MILVDTSIWVEHLRRGDKILASLLDAATVLTHPFIIGEVALGNLRQRAVVMNALAGLPCASVATCDEVLHFIHHHTLHGRGVGYVDVALLASVTLTELVALWTQEKRLLEVATELGLAFRLPP